MRRHPLACLTVAVTAGLVLPLAPIATASASTSTPTSTSTRASGSSRLTPRTFFTMAADGSSGRRPEGAAIPNIDSVKSTIRAYYGATDGIADKKRSPYITEVSRIAAGEAKRLPTVSPSARKAVVLDADDTTLWTYDMEDAAMGFDFDPALQDEYVQAQRFPATPGMVDLVADVRAKGYTVFGLTGRNDDQKTATLANLDRVGYRGFTADRFFTKWTGKGASQRPSYVRCRTSDCTTVEYKASTRRHIERDLGYDIALNVGDQWSDLQGGSADRTVKLPNPTYYLPSPDLPGRHEPQLAPRTRFVMAPDGSSGRIQGGEGIPNIDSVKATVRTYYRATDGLADKKSSPYITEMKRLADVWAPRLRHRCALQDRRAEHGGKRPALVLDADDTTLWTYDMEDAAMGFDFDPALQDVYVQRQKFPPTPAMRKVVRAARKGGCAIVGITGRNRDQQRATIKNLNRYYDDAFRARRYFTKWTGKGASQQPSYVRCRAEKCTTVEYKSQTRRHLQRDLGYRVVANMGDQFSDLLGGHAQASVKLPNPTYYLP